MLREKSSEEGINVVSTELKEPSSSKFNDLLGCDLIPSFIIAIFDSKPLREIFSKGVSVGGIIPIVASLKSKLRWVPSVLGKDYAKQP